MKASEAVHLFEKNSRDEKLHLKKPHTGCFWRTAIIAQQIPEGDAYAVYVEDNNRNMEGRIAYREKGEDETVRPSVFAAKWKFHIAAAAKVVDVDGKTKDMVLDVAMFDGPVDVASWARAITADGRPLTEKDVRLMPYAEAELLVQRVCQETGGKDAEAFFDAQPDRFAGKQIIRRPSAWLKKYRQVQAAMLRMHTGKDRL